MRLSDAFPNHADVEAALQRIVASGAAAWPDVPLDPRVLVAHLARHLNGDDVASALADVHAADVHLACAAAQGVPRAVAILRAEIVTNVPAWLGSMRLDDARLDEATHAIVTRLLVARPDGPPRVADYAGRGPLGGWLRVAAVRTALNLREAERPQDVELDEQVLGPPGTDVELDHIRHLHREDFAAAFREALEGLESRDRALLGLHWLDGVPTTRLGEMYGVHRTSVARWLEEAQERLLTSTRERFAARISVAPEDADSLMRLLQSRLDVSLRVLRNRSTGSS